MKVIQFSIRSRPGKLIFVLQRTESLVSVSALRFPMP